MSNALFGWKRIAARVKGIRAEMPLLEKILVFAHKFLTTSQLAFYLNRDMISTTLRHEFDQYHLWFSSQRYTGWDALFADDNRWTFSPGRYLALFENTDINPVVIKVFREGDLARSMKIYKCYGFKGDS